MSIKTPLVVVSYGFTIKLKDRNNNLVCDVWDDQEAAEIAAKLNLWPQMVALLKEYNDAIACPCAKDLLAACEKIEKFAFAQAEPGAASRRMLVIIDGTEDQPTVCQASREGDCDYPDCPQNRDGEPQKSGRHCPLDSKEGA